MTQQITNLDEAMDTTHIIEEILSDLPDIVWLIEWRSPEDLVKRLSVVTKDCEEVVTRLKQLLVWAKLTEGVDIPF